MLSKSRQSHLIAIIALLVALSLVPITAQDAEITEEPAPTIPTATPVPSFTPTFTPSPTMTATSTAIPTLMTPISNTATTTATYTQTPLIESTEELNPISPTQTTQPVIIATATLAGISGTQASAITPTLSTVSGTQIPTTTPTLSAVSGTEIPIAISSTQTAISTTLTPTIMPNLSGTQITATITPTLQATAIIGAIPLQYKQGIVRYQNREDNAGIQIQIVDDSLTLISEVLTNSDGIYSVAVPLEAAYWIVLSADGHRTERFYLQAIDDVPLEVNLLAGDLNDDECINFNDLAIMQSRLTISDLPADFNGDSKTDISDVALLTGNLNPNCVVEVEATATPTPMMIMTPLSSISGTELLTPTPMIAISPTTSIATPMIEVTEEASP